MISLLTFIIFICSIILHEIAHGLAAERLGDPTARFSGRLTLNPISHIDPLMSIVVPLFLVLTGSPIIFGAAKPVPIDPYNLKNVRKDMGLVGLAGPAANLLIAVFFAVLARIFLGFSSNQAVLQLFSTACLLNVFLACFNLIPIPPLDGGRVLVAILPQQYAEALAGLESIGMFIIIFLLFFPNNFFSLQSIIYKISGLIFSFIFPPPAGGFPLV